MTDKLPYQNPDTPRPAQTRRRVAKIALLTMAIAVAMLPLAWLVGSYYGRFIVAFAVAGFLFGASVLINSFIDWLKER